MEYLVTLYRGTCMAVALLAVLLLTACGGSQSGHVAAPSVSPTARTSMPTSLHIYRISGPSGSNVAPFEAQSHQADKVQHLFAAMLAVPAFNQSPTCPNDRGGGYVLTFLDQNNSTFAQAFIPAGGCSLVDLSKPYGCHTLPYEIMQRLAETLDVRQSALGLEGEFYDTAPPGSPTAPTTLSSPLLPMSSCR
jgi:hypothetical protein